MNIVLTVGSLGLGGAERQCVELACQLKEKGHTVCVVYFNSKSEQLLERLLNSGIRTTCIQPYYKADPLSILKLIIFFRKNRFEIVHSFLFTAGYISRIAALFAGIKIVIHGERMGDYSRSKKLIRVDKLLAGFTSHYVANCYAGKNYLLQTVKVPERKISVIHNGIDTDCFSSIPKKSTNGNTIIMVGRLWPQKNYEGALAVISQVRSIVHAVRIHIAGDNESNNNELVQLKKTLMERSQQVDLFGCVEWLGYRNDVAEVLAASDIYLSTSHHEGCQNSMMEAMAAGLPVVVPNISDNTCIITHGREGFIIPTSTDTQGFTDALVLLLTDMELRKRMGNNARQRIQEFSVKTFGNKHVELYEKLLAEKTRKKNT